MGIKQTPTNVNTYYKLMRTAANNKIEIISTKLDKYYNTQKAANKELSNNALLYKTRFNIDLNSYKEFTSNKYIDGKFLKVCNGAYINKGEDYKLVGELYNLLVYAKAQKEIHDLELELKKYNKISELTLKQYTEILRTYYTQVHKELILNGHGYVFGHRIGWICVNRCLLTRAKPMLDFAATKKREKELLSQGKRIYNKEEAEWCKRNGIEYIAEDKRVFRRDEYCYEVPLIGCKLPNGGMFKLTTTDYRHGSIRGKTNDDLIKECNNDITAICNLPIDLKTKVTLCDKVDKILYTKFIRNENQTSLNLTKVNSKNR